MKSDVRPLIETRKHEEDTLHRWMHGEKEWITKIITASFVAILCVAGVVFKDFRIASVALYCVIAFVQILEWTRIPHITAQKRDRHILTCLIMIPGFLTFVLAGATDPNMREGIALQAFGLIGLYTVSILKRYHDMSHISHPEA